MLKLLLSLMLALPVFVSAETVFLPEEGEPSISAAVDNVFLTSEVLQDIEGWRYPYADFRAFSKPYGKFGVDGCGTRFLFELTDQPSFGDVLQDARVNGSKVTLILEDVENEEVSACFIRGLLPGKADTPDRDVE